MSFLIFMLCGFAGGLLGGMGLGGGTALIPLLTLACGVTQTAAQGVNLVAFLPMSAAALAVHYRSGLLKGEGLMRIIVPALIFSVLFSLVAAALPARALKQGFGVFLCILSAFQLKSCFGTKNLTNRKNILPKGMDKPRKVW